MRLRTEPYVIVEVEGTEFRFMVDTGAAISLVKPDRWQVQVDPTEVTARDITGNDLKIVGKQTVVMRIGNVECEHTFLVSEIGTPGDGILGVDFLQSVRATVDLKTGYLQMGTNRYRLIESTKGLVVVVRTPTGGDDVLSSCSKELDTPMGDCITSHHSLAGSKGTGPEDPVGHAEVHLPGTTLLSPLSVKIVHGKIVGRCNLTSVPHEVVFEPVQAMVPGIYAPNCASTVELVQDPVNPACGNPTRSKDPMLYVPSVPQSSEPPVLDELHPRFVGPVEWRITQNRESETRECSTKNRDSETKIDQMSCSVETSWNDVSQENRSIHSKCSKLESNRVRNLGYIPVQILNTSEEEIVLSKGYRLREVAPFSLDQHV